MIPCGDYLTLNMVIRFEEHIILLLPQEQMSIVIWWMMFGTSSFHLKCLCLCGVSFAIDCLLKIIWQGGGSFKQLTQRVRQHVVLQKQQNICSWIAVLLVLFSHLFFIG